MKKHKYARIILGVLAICALLTTAVFAVERMITYETLAEKEAFVKQVPVNSSLDNYFDFGSVFNSNDHRSEISKPQLRSANTEESKIYLFDRMLNSIDYFSSVEGEFTQSTSIGEPSDIINYSIQLQPNEKSLSSRKSAVQSKTYTLYCADNSYYSLDAEINPDTKIASIPVLRNQASYELPSSDKNVRDIKTQSRIQELPNGEKIYYYRQDDFITGEAKASLFPQEMIMGYLGDFLLWNITDKETYANRDCWIVEGSLTGEYSEKLGVNTFTFFVDSDTGVLLKYEGKNNNGDIVSNLYTTSISIDEEINQSVFYDVEAMVIGNAK